MLSRRRLHPCIFKALRLHATISGSRFTKLLYSLACVDTHGTECFFFSNLKEHSWNLTDGDLLCVLTGRIDVSIATWQILSVWIDGHGWRFLSENVRVSWCAHPLPTAWKGGAILWRRRCRFVGIVDDIFRPGPCCVRTEEAATWSPYIGHFARFVDAQCKNHSRNRWRLFPFPIHQKGRHLWEVKTTRNKGQATNCSRVCSVSISFCPAFECATSYFVRALVF